MKKHEQFGGAHHGTYRARDIKLNLDHTLVSQQQENSTNGFVLSLKRCSHDLW